MTTITVSLNFLAAFINTTDIQKLPRLVLFTRSYDIAKDSFPMSKDKYISSIKNWLKRSGILPVTENYNGSFIEDGNNILIPFSATEEHMTEFDLDDSTKMFN